MKSWNATLDEISVLDTHAYELLASVYFGIRGVEALLSIIGNLLTIVAISCFKSLRTTTNMFILSLAVSDLIAGACVYPTDVVAHFTREQSRVWYRICKLQWYFIVIHFVGNVFGIFLIGVERYLKLHYPLRYPLWMTKNRAVCLIMSSWIVVLLIATLFAFLLSNEDVPSVCSLFLVFPTGLIMWSLIMAFGIVSVCTCALYLKIAHLAIRKSKQMVDYDRDLDSSSVQFKVTKMLFYVLGLYYGLYLPHAIISLLTVEEGLSLFQMFLYKVSLVLWYGNTWCNPLVYAWKCRDMRQAFKQLLHMN